ncbi:MAG: hypothetical protein M1818_000102 [Claussenomyces sp. TS43310]|nr:MAG: hypothetical protein M1818_000102 [Claussenomyces sp. TS43310]
MTSTNHQDDAQYHEPHPNPQASTSNPDPTQTSSSGVDYEPHPERSLPLPPARQKIVDCITTLYSGSASEEDMQVYSEQAIYDDVNIELSSIERFTFLVRYNEDLC